MEVLPEERMGGGRSMLMRDGSAPPETKQIRVDRKSITRD